jgi:hypothetical protein
MGVGPVTASAVVATVGDFKQFKNGAQFGAWLIRTAPVVKSGFCFAFSTPSHAISTLACQIARLRNPTAHY